jgi:pimeloyl-ACP methyl ester carboxylesterase
VSRLAFDAVEQLTRVVEAMHANIAAASPPLGRGTDGRTRGVTGFVYGAIRGVNGAARATLDQGLARLPAGVPGPRAESWRSALNGVLGDHLAASGNPLALPMQLRSEGRALSLERDALAAALPRAGGRVLVLVHGLCMSDRGWTRNGHDHGRALARDLDVTPLHLLYNSGRPITEIGRELSALLERLLDAWPAGPPELAILGHSMGGLVARSACRHAAEAGHVWPGGLRKLVFLGTPHHGAPLERGGRWLEGALGVSPYTVPLARLGAGRSAGLRDLRHGDATPLPAGVACYAAAGTLGPGPIGDGLVPLASALGRHRRPEQTLAFPEAHTWIGSGLGHFDLLDHPEVYARLRAWLA